MKKLEIRMLMIDLGRQKETLDYLKHYIDFAKENEYNTIILYLEAAIKVACTPFFNPDQTYTEDEIRQIVAYANERNIDVIPHMESLAHADNFLRYKELEDFAECQDAQVDGRGVWTGRGDCICISNPDAVKFMDTYWSQVLSLFTSPYVHAGMDEPFDFAICPRCTQRLKNGETKKDLFYEYVMHTYDLIKSFGRTMIMGDDFFQYLDVIEMLPRDIIINNWNYGYVNEEPEGLWINRIKKDWLRYYDELGFRYIFTAYANQTGKLFNTDSYTNYAMKYRPMGAVMSVWERSHRFNYSGYPAIAYTGRFWNGKATPKDKVKIYTEYLGSEEAADIVLNLEAYGDSFQDNSLQVCENMTQSRHFALNVAEYSIRKLKEIYDKMEDGLQKDIMLDLYIAALDRYLTLKKHHICLAVFDNYEVRSKTVSEYVEQLEQMKQQSEEAYTLAKTLWAKCRPGIPSMHGQFERKYDGRSADYDSMIQQIKTMEKHGVFYVDLMSHCPWGTAKMEIEVHYKDKTIPATVLKAQGKVGTGCNTVRFQIENKAVDYVVFSTYGEGAVFPLHFRYTYGGKKYHVSSATKLAGEAKNLKMVLNNDTRFAEMGNNDGLAHFNDIRLSKIKHQIKLKFKRMK